MQLTADMKLAKDLDINFCEELEAEGTPWEVPAEQEPQYFETLPEAIKFLVIMLKRECDKPASPPSSPGAPQEPDDFTLSKNSLAREFFDCGYDGCTASQKVLIDSRYAQLTRASSPGADTEQK